MDTAEQYVDSLGLSTDVCEAGWYNDTSGPFSTSSHSGIRLEDTADLLICQV